VDFLTFCRLVGDNVRRARWLRGMTQERVAAQGFNYRFFQELERGGRNPSLRTLFDLAEVLGVTVRDLVDVGHGKPLRRPLRLRRLTPPKRGRKPRSKASG
jgi:transcriptional regulator with XRE-family HTH domain